MPVGKPGARLATDVGIPDSPLRPTVTDHSSDPGWRPGHPRPSARLRTWCFGPWTSSRVTFGPTPKNENENEDEDDLMI